MSWNYRGWNYRVVRYTVQDDVLFAIVLVRYDRARNPDFVGAGVEAFEQPDDLREAVDDMRGAFAKPILDLSATDRLLVPWLVRPLRRQRMSGLPS